MATYGTDNGYPIRKVGRFADHKFRVWWDGAWRRSDKLRRTIGMQNNIERNRASNF